MLELKDQMQVKMANFKNTDEVRIHTQMGYVYACRVPKEFSNAMTIETDKIGFENAVLLSENQLVLIKGDKYTVHFGGFYTADIIYFKKALV